MRFTCRGLTGSRSTKIRDLAGHLHHLLRLEVRGDLGTLTSLAGLNRGLGLSSAVFDQHVGEVL
jgi:hypothetical protein